ncbi:hypothetical protein [Wohlfahrtiimonas chitiniclastica]|uniref:hypothetical protein n=1 Tax=Wohlfahrtiimonas chitiniclastica TaxID=400946 RepID=UPI001BCD59C7|nr:hypothetical protein [Wohlfahrtiimonas chitiniclastica]MBS7829228.1 hypothetical protein [Wohlfahrtiimonas chitiniclastica]MBS7836466.1 hypothetical protein [Wohlfahrtiimonas chitiniclastica]
MKDNKIDDNYPVLGTMENQGELFLAETHVMVEDVEMGVLESGIPYLTGRGLERLCGVSHAPFHRLTADWHQERNKPRGLEIQKLLMAYGYPTNADLFIRVQYNGREITAFTEPVCMAFLEYYAFVSPEPREQARSMFRILAKTKFTEFIYQKTGYSPHNAVSDAWRHFHDRVDLTLNSVEHGYFSVFHEIAVMIVPMIRNGVMISDKVVPDISVGQAWSKFWLDNDMDSQYGARKKYSHEYPLYYPQSKSNPQMAFCYPNEALGMFRNWFESTYITTKLPRYLLGQTKKGLDREVYQKAIESFKIHPVIDKK